MDLFVLGSKRLLALIDRALDTGNRRAFMEYSGQLKSLKRAQERRLTTAEVPEIAGLEST